MNANGLTNILIRPMPASAESAALVQRLFEASPRYFNAIQGSLAGPHEAAEALSALPPKTEVHQKHNLGIYLDSELVGYADLIKGYPTAKHAYLGLLIIDENHQEKGVGRAAFEELEKIAQTWSGIEIFRLGVIATNDVVGFWKKMGFAQTRRLLHSLKPNIKTKIVEMEKRLSL
jgi:GNAT superfamily N-acetyltransferase